jgi:hypothetical protein
MLVACRLTGLSAREVYYAGVDAHLQMLDSLARARRELQRRDPAAGEGLRRATGLDSGRRDNRRLR